MCLRGSRSIVQTFVREVVQTFVRSKWKHITWNDLTWDRELETMPRMKKAVNVGAGFEGVTAPGSVAATSEKAALRRRVMTTPYESGFEEVAGAVSAGAVRAKDWPRPVKGLHVCGEGVVKVREGLKACPECRSPVLAVVARRVVDGEEKLTTVDGREWARVV